ncbi:MAG: sigma-70 family RNA polymerase sigma factor, partial [Candidatus Taylorbacteria bacterium]|nr:sigma-70 family RNA polymerase sigma factor [Candidatus Taylorbacteria bacterium]
ERYNQLSVFSGTRMPVLSDEELALLLEESKCLDLDRRKKALEKIIFSNIGIIVKKAMPFCGNDISLRDLVPTGILVLLEKVIPRYDPTIAKFSTYATHWLLNSFHRLRVTESPGPGVHLSSGFREKLNSVRKAESFLRNRSPLPTPEEIVSHLKIHGSEKAKRLTVQGVEHFLADTSTRAVSFDSRLSQEGILTLYDVTEDRNAGTPEEILTIKQEVEFWVKRLYDEIDRLSDRNSDILNTRYGLQDSPPRKLQEIADELKVSIQRVQQMEDRAIHLIAKRCQLPKAGVQAILSFVRDFNTQSNE